MESDFAGSLLDAPQPTIIGVRMRPFSLGHKMLLARIGSAFVTRAMFPTFDDLISTTCICAHTWEENQKLLRSKWRQRITLRVWGTFAGRFDVPGAVVALWRYVNVGMSYPVDIDPPKQGEGRELCAPSSARLLLFLRRSGFSETEAMNLPLPFAHWLDAAGAEEDGKLNLVSRRTMALIAAAREMV